MLIVAATLLLTGVFGNTECLLLVQRCARFGESLFRLRTSDSETPRQQFARLGDTGEWDRLWQSLTRFAERRELNAIHLNISLPARQVEYHATWESPHYRDDSQSWRADVPLVRNRITVGRLHLSGICGGSSVTLQIQRVLTGLRAVNAEFPLLIDGWPPQVRHESTRLAESLTVPPPPAQQRASATSTGGTGPAT